MALAGLLAGCNSKSAVTPAPVGAAQHLYVGNNNTPGTVQVYTLPITSSSTPTFSFAANNVVAVEVDPNGNAVVSDNAGTLRFFAAPLSATSVPTAIFTNSSGAVNPNGSITFMPTGDFWVSNATNRVNRFNAPFSNASTPIAFVTDASITSAVGTALDASQNLYVSNRTTGTATTCSSGATTCSSLLVYAPPYTGAPIITPLAPLTSYRKMAVSGGVLFVCSILGSGRVDAYNLPLTSASVPAFAITIGVNVPEAVAFDASGNMYVGNFGNATVTEYRPPFSAASAPVVTLTVGDVASFFIFGMSVGK